ncbi:P-loop containing nucleoside triphosphate hydrolase protein [Choiromyces venosus 120613-1]|uniref:P-loop containing nucleoside triphosphate hydrolase protein n=1 Tax=Choiromyces venosus 120613-1 TaxID=1336337 RepID=A0A3N4JN01_9PEZI|nr:P-loop containing nucleoside triphosphate hydrolase protein [Choiromyces venosus 120613-1]
MDPTTQLQIIREWYDKLQPIRVDLVGDYAGEEFFVIEGDSLLRWVFADERIDFDTGFQLLHAVYVVESFLQQLSSRQCRFSVVFLDISRNACIPCSPTAEQNAWKYLFARSAIIEHMKRIDHPLGLVFTFESLADPKLRQYLDSSRPYFVMYHDGADASQFQKAHKRPDWEVKYAGERENNNNTEDKDATDTPPAEYVDSSIGGGFNQEGLLKTGIREWMSLGFNIALMNEILFKDSKIFTYVLETNLHTLEPVYIRVNPAETPPPGPEFSQAPDWKSIQSARERLAVATVAHALRLDERKHEDLASIFLVHIILLSQLTLPERFFAPFDIDEAVSTAIDPTQGFLKRLVTFSGDLLKIGAVSFEDTQNDLCDYVDGRLLLKLILEPEELSGEVKQKFSNLADQIETLCGKRLELSVLSKPVNVSFTELPIVKRCKILAFSNPAFDKYLEQIRLPVDIMAEEGSEDHEEEDDQVYYEKTHWHNPRNPLVTARIRAQRALPKPVAKVRGAVAIAPGTKTQESDKAARRAAGRARKWEQVYLNQMYQYASSLTDSIDGGLNPKLVTVEEKTKKPQTAGKKTTAKEEKNPKPNKKDGPSKGKGSGKLSAAEIISQNNATKKAGREAKLQDSWKSICDEVASIKDDESAISRLEIWLATSQKGIAASVAENKEWPFIEAEARLYKIQLLQRIWIGYCKRKEQEHGYAAAAALFNEARLVLFSGGMTRKVHQILTNTFEAFGVPKPPSDPIASLPDRKILFTKVWDGKCENLDIKLGTTSEEFQLLHCGPWMDRNMDSQPDPRVPFKPDGWQRKVLDELDQDNSIFAVAPTSAGKTFIAFYAMEKVLKESDEGVLVYVAPTKALVNQIAAEVISRYKKNYRYAGKTVWAIHTRDYRMNNANECQILITVPDILQIMLMSPSNAKTWTPRVKRIIFDEVHSIGNADNGLVWEQLLLLAPCPIIALSATVGNPEEFGSWLTSTQRSIGVKLTIVQHPYRYSDLRKFVYSPKKGMASFEGMPQKVSRFNQLDMADNMRVIHPVAALLNTKQGMPNDMSLEPKDCLQLYWAMSKCQTEECPFPKALEFEEVFGTEGKVITKAEVVKWEESLKKLLHNWMKDVEPVFTEVAKLLAAEAAKQDAPAGEGNDEKSSGTFTEGDGPLVVDLPPPSCTKEYLEKTTLPLLQTLHSANALPAILFSYDRRMCERICIMICSQLATAEKNWRENSPKWQKIIKDWEKYKADRGSRGSKKAKIVLPPGSTKADQMRENAEYDSSFWSSFDPNHPSPEFSFADFKKHAKSDLQTDIDNLIHWGIPEALVHAFSRGIGVHHSGMNRKYRQAVEMLFRKGYLRVVIATGTLSLGINMPTRSSVFVGESVYLNSLNYRQAAGRAGRRGFDNLGNVVFHAISLAKVERIMSSKLPSLIGHFPISTSLVLRLFILLHNSNESDHAKHTINTLLTQGKLVIGGGEFKEQVLHHLRFSIEFLRRQKLIGSNGRPLNFAGLTSHLYYIENSSFAFHVLLCNGYMQELCKNINKSPDSTLLELMLVLANIFGREQRFYPRHKSLPPLPAAAAELLAKQNEQTLRTYVTYVESFVESYCKTPDNVLPFSKLECGGKDTAGESNLKSRSSFVSLSGHGDNFTSVEDLASSIRRGVLIDGASVPYMPVDDSSTVNGYLYYFYLHGDVKKLDQEHGVNAGNVWFVLKDFSLILAAIEAGLTCFIRDGPGAYYDFKDEGDDVDGDIHEDDEDDKESVTTSTTTDDGSSGVSSETAGPGYKNVLKAVSILRRKFEEKFKKMWA